MNSISQHDKCRIMPTETEYVTAKESAYFEAQYDKMISTGL